jgi:hypothetical protein
MRAPELVSLVVLVLITAIAWIRKLSRRRRLTVSAVGLLGILLILLFQAVQRSHPRIVRGVEDWIPALWILMIYWQSGQTYTGPNRRLQYILLRFDHEHLCHFLERWKNHWSKTWIGAYFEIAYFTCYPLLPLGVGVLYLTSHRSAIDYYWTMVVLATYPCYILLAFAPTLPPRLLASISDPIGALPEQSPVLPRAQIPYGVEIPAQPKGPSGNKLRGFNLWLLKYVSIHVNTFPSAHVASTIAASLVLVRVISPVGVGFLWISISIAIAAVLGRYHYALDALTGAAIPAIIFLAHLMIAR